MRRVISGLLVLLMLIPLASCGGNTAPPADSGVTEEFRGTQGTGAL